MQPIVASKGGFILQYIHCSLKANLYDVGISYIVWCFSMWWYIYHIIYLMQLWYMYVLFLYLIIAINALSLPDINADGYIVYISSPKTTFPLFRCLKITMSAQPGLHIDIFANPFQYALAGRRLVSKTFDNAASHIELELQVPLLETSPGLQHRLEIVTTIDPNPMKILLTTLVDCKDTYADCFEFSCKDGSCVARDLLCDGNADCSTEEDENTSICGNVVRKYSAVCSYHGQYFPNTCSSYTIAREWWQCMGFCSKLMAWGPFHKRFFQIRWKFGFSVTPLWCIISLYGFAHAKTAQLSCHVPSDHFTATWMRTEWNFHRIWISMENSFVKSAFCFVLHWSLHCCVQWASYQMRKIASSACAGIAGNTFPDTDFKENR